MCGRQKLCVLVRKDYTIQRQGSLQGELVYVPDTLAIPAAHLEVSLPLLWITVLFDVEVPYIE